LDLNSQAFYYLTFNLYAFSNLTLSTANSLFQIFLRIFIPFLLFYYFSSCERTFLPLGLSSQPNQTLPSYRHHPPHVRLLLLEDVPASAARYQLPPIVPLMSSDCLTPKLAGATFITKTSASDHACSPAPIRRQRHSARGTELVASSLKPMPWS
jgi:hypothetical protein